MDEKDFEILKILDKNCRTSYSDIADHVSLSLRNVSSRVEKMIDREVIKRFTVQFNYSTLGYRHFIGSIRPNNEMPRIDFFKELQLIPEIYRIWELVNGSLTVSFFSKNAKHLEEIINSILKIANFDYTETRLHFPIDVPFSKTDWQIIFYLINNSRASKKKMGEELSISEKTVKRRLNRMKNMKLLTFIPEINFEAISGMIPAVVSLSTKGPSKQIYHKIKKDPSIKYWRSAGSVFPSIVLFLYGNNLTDIYKIYRKLEARDDIKTARLTFVVKNLENSTLIEDAILEKLQLD